MLSSPTSSSSSSGVRVAAGGGEWWRQTTHEEALVFFAPTTSDLSKGTRRRHRRLLLDDKEGTRLQRRRGAAAVTSSTWQKCQVHLARHMSRCLPLPLPLSDTRTKVKSTGVPSGHRVPVDPFIARYGGRLRGGATDEPEAEDSKYQAEEQLLKICTALDGMFDGCQYLPIFYMMKDEFGLGPVDISLTFGITMVPWVLKPFMAILSDRVPIMDRRRTPYMVAGILAIAGSLVGANVSTSYTGTLISFTGLTLGRSLLSAVMQAMLVEVGRPRAHDGVTKLVGDYFLYRTTGSLFSAIATTIVVSNFGPRRAVSLALLLPACMLLKVIHYESSRTGEVLPEAAATNSSSIVDGFRDLKVMLRQPAVWGPLAFLFIYNAGPNYDDSLYVYFVNVLNFEPYMVGQLVVMHSLAKVAGVFLYRYKLRNMQDRKLIVTLTAISCPVILMPLLLTTGMYQTLHINPRLLALSGELVREVFVHLQMMPAMARWVQLAPEQSEGTIVSLLMGTMNLSRAFSKGSSAIVTSALGVTATNFDNLSLLITICGTSVLLPIAFASDLIPNDPDRSSDACLEDIGSGPAAFDGARSDRRSELLDDMDIARAG